MEIPLAGSRTREAEGLTLQPFGVASCQLGTALGIVSAMGELPFMGNLYPVSLAPSKVISGVPGNPSLEVVCLVGGENLSSSGIVSKMCYFDFLSFSSLHLDYITLLVFCQ